MLRLLTILITLMPLLAIAQTETLPEIPDNGPDGVPQQGDGDRLEGDLSNQNSNNGNVTKTYNGAGSNGMPASSAISPSLMSSGTESCLQSISGGLQLIGVGVSSGKYIQDAECNRRRNAYVLSNVLGMKVAGVSLMCQNPDVWLAMFMSATPCPIIRNGKLLVGKNALLEVKSNPELWIPDYIERKDFFDQILAGGNYVESQESGSISDRFRSTRGNGTRQSDN
jgi:hypothetical protein